MNVYEWQGKEVVAQNRDAARQLLIDEYGVGVRKRDIKIAKGPFALRSDTTGKIESVTREQYANEVGTYAGGLVYEP